MWCDVSPYVGDCLVLQILDKPWQTHNPWKPTTYQNVTSPWEYSVLLQERYVRVLGVAEGCQQQAPTARPRGPVQSSNGALRMVLIQYHILYDWGCWVLHHCISHICFDIDMVWHGLTVSHSNGTDLQLPIASHKRWLSGRQVHGPAGSFSLGSACGFPGAWDEICETGPSALLLPWMIFCNGNQWAPSCCALQDVWIIDNISIYNQP